MGSRMGRMPQGAKTRGRFLLIAEDEHGVQERLPSGDREVRAFWANWCQKEGLTLRVYDRLLHRCEVLRPE